MVEALENFQVPKKVHWTAELKKFLSSVLPVVPWNLDTRIDMVVAFWTSLSANDKEMERRDLKNF